MTHHKNIVFLVESRNGSERLKQLLTQHQDSHNLQFIQTTAIGLYHFKYPKEIKLSDLPCSFEPQWQPRKENKLLKLTTAPYTIKQHEFVPIGLTISETLQQADIIVLTEYHDTSSIHSMHKILEAHPHQAEVLLLPDSVPKQKDMDSIFNGTAQRLQDNEELKQLHEQSKVKEYFDYNFNIHSAYILGQCLTVAGINHPNYVMSKNSLLTLHYIRTKRTISMPDLLMVFQENWKGTGKYAVTSLGSIVSRTEILFTLIEAGLLTKLHNDLELSDKGHAFLNMLHPDCCDLDLPQRIEQWMILGSTAYPKIDKYVRTFFGKQMRFFNKLHLVEN